MTVWWGNDARWDLCGTEQRVGQFDVSVATGNASMVTNSSATPATLHMGMIFTHGDDTIPPKSASAATFRLISSATSTKR